MNTIEEFGLGRLHVPDERDKMFPMSALLEQEEVKRYQYWWPFGWWGDQGATPQCVAYAWLHYAEDGPITHAPKSAGAGPILNPGAVYRHAQRIDQWPGENYAGTSVRAGAKVLQVNGFIGSYHWAWDLPTVVQALLYSGPVVVGTNWYTNMFNPDASGLITVGGSVAGGHAYVLNGVNTDRRIIRIKNSWGRRWGKNGHAYISFDDMDRLLAEFGEACVAVEIERDA